VKLHITTAKWKDLTIVKLPKIFLAELEPFKNDDAHGSIMSRDEAMLCIGISSDLISKIQRALKKA
jgi:hypothetical protein